MGFSRSLEEQAKILSAGRSNNELDASKLKAEFPGCVLSLDLTQSFPSPPQNFWELKNRCLNMFSSLPMQKQRQRYVIVNFLT